MSKLAKNNACFTQDEVLRVMQACAYKNMDWLREQMARTNANNPRLPILVIKTIIAKVPESQKRKQLRLFVGCLNNLELLPAILRASYKGFVGNTVLLEIIKLDTEVAKAALRQLEPRQLIDLLYFHKMNLQIFAVVDESLWQVVVQCMSSDQLSDLKEQDGLPDWALAAVKKRYTEVTTPNTVEEIRDELTKSVIEIFGRAGLAIAQGSSARFAHRSSIASYLPSGARKNIVAESDKKAAEILCTMAGIIPRTK